MGVLQEETKVKGFIVSGDRGWVFWDLAWFFVVTGGAIFLFGAYSLLAATLVFDGVRADRVGERIAVDVLGLGREDGGQAVGLGGD